jgi:hypothetical protein
VCAVVLRLVTGHESEDCDCCEVRVAREFRVQADLEVRMKKLISEWLYFIVPNVGERC